MSKSFEELYAQLRETARTRPEGSGTVERLDAGVHEIGKKIVEEAAEVWMAAEYEVQGHHEHLEVVDQLADLERGGVLALVLEISQLIYHLQVLMVSLDLELADVYERL